ncbi:MAG: HNH endonuclease family protein [Frankiaceae bacterium]|nr:HNH endonuclease family protein [Frankiaceae bacterium]
MSIAAGLVVLLVMWLLSDGLPRAEAPGGGPRASNPAEARAQLGRLSVVAARPHVSGYQRACGPEQGCTFGNGWMPSGQGAGCTTRDLVLASQLSKIKYANGSRCHVVAGALADPYTGTKIQLTPASPGAVQIDHIFPLAAAFDLGAAKWPQSQRNQFAQDLDELVAVSGSANAAKGDSTPGEWMPAAVSYRCSYAARYVAVAAKYSLSITKADEAALSAALSRCPA